MEKKSTVEIVLSIDCFPRHRNRRGKPVLAAIILGSWTNSQHISLQWGSDFHEKYRLQVSLKKKNRSCRILKIWDIYVPTVPPWLCFSRGTPQNKSRKKCVFTSSLFLLYVPIFQLCKILGVAVCFMLLYR